ncbi:hypothetical protein G1K81_04210 [Tenacibaculum finnmarkense]|uniref:hypothetical protein n=1 Tax=Tenacibaculum finnmarkense TaxID=2781243 RepID=UPI001EFAB3F6|nr:hypothetical protein [Tenacibaculum finnmarkense]MCG8232952.1 hypothetical protein [Tenacibaculum finnmarkense genomovar finnmarkense]MCG8242833.1 hypothetical protein [Tenacibaculum finnmarkense genomovar finnmarkense]MCG8842688.1 hypothetical protein [Tenacibaculum finnmarkense]MCG8861154.1 hypothetical protein [Tenacibaculum finnmarkense]MCG8863837.1 hypothetical protein [Tenacibaculum finnmarkense]
MNNDFLSYWEEKRKNKIRFILFKNFKASLFLVVLPILFALSDNAFLVDQNLIMPLFKNIVFFMILCVVLNFYQFKTNEGLFKKSLKNEK